MSLSPGTLGPEAGTLLVKTYREGVAAKVGHDLVIEVTRWDATVGPDSVELNADPRSLEVREGVRGVKPLTDHDRDEIRKTIENKVLGTDPIAFRSTSVESEDATMTVAGDLTMAGRTRPVSARLDVDADGRVTGTIPVTQSEWGIKPYRGLMGALKVRDEVEIVIDARAPRPSS
jgi:polyisoprenoid-binding protein YceI